MANIAIAARERAGGKRVSARTREPYGILWPDGSASLSWQYREDSQPATLEEEWNWTSGGELSSEAARRVGDLPPILDSTAKFTQPPPEKRKKYGLAGITSYGRKMVRSACVLLEREKGEHRPVFATFTVPALSASERRHLAAEWGAVTGRLIQKIGRVIERRAAAPVIVSVTEIQPRRLQETGQAYLHLHLVFPGASKSPGDYYLSASEIRAWWKSELERRIGRSLHDTPQVKLIANVRSVAKYLAKYLSKGCGMVGSAVEDLGEESIPGQWWNINKWARIAVKKSTHRGFRTGELLENLLRFLEGEDYKISGCSCGPVIVPSDGEPLLVAWWFNLWGELFDDLTGMLDSIRSESS